MPRHHDSYFAGDRDDDGTDLSDDEPVLTTAGMDEQSEANEASRTLSESAPHHHSKAAVSNARSNFYKRPELYHERWKEQFLAKRSDLAERLRQSSHAPQVAPDAVGESKLPQHDTSTHDGLPSSSQTPVKGHRTSVASSASS